MKFYCIFILMLTVNFQVHANTEKTIKSLIPTGYSLVKEYEMLKDPSLTESDLIYNSSSVVDFNKDGFDDVAMLVEKTVCYLQNSDGSCVEPYYYGAESRRLLIFLGHANDKYELFLKTTNGILNYGESANEFKEPLTGFYVDYNGSISISYSGGTDLTWSYDIQIKFIDGRVKPDFYVTSLNTTWMEWTVDPHKINNDYITKYIYRDYENGIVQRTSYVTKEQWVEEYDDDDYKEETKEVPSLKVLPLRSMSSDEIFSIEN